MRLTAPGRVEHVLATVDAVGGVWTYAVELARGLAARGVRTTLAVLGPAPGVDQRAEAEAVPGLSLIDTGLPLDWTAGSAAEVDCAGIRLAVLAAQLRPDLVHLNSPALAASARFPAPVVGVAHSCVATWWRAVKPGLPLPADFAWRTELVARGYAACDALVAPTRAFAEATAAVYGLAEPPTIVWNGRTPAPAPASQAPAAFAFTAGRLWDEGKGLAALDRAAARLSVPVRAAGPTRAPHGGDVALRHLQLLGRLDAREMAAVLARRPVFVSAALYEPFGLAVLEAAQAGCALVLSDIPTFRELWNGAALFVAPQDDAAIACAIESLIADPAARARLAEAAASRAERYSVDATVEKMLSLYRSLLAPSPTHNGAETLVRSSSSGSPKAKPGGQAQDEGFYFGKADKSCVQDGAPSHNPHPEPVEGRGRADTAQVRA